jgi:hypothetical protein
MIQRNRVFMAALRYQDRLPSAMVARLLSFPPELALPAYPTAGLSVAEDRVVLRAEQDALSPWKDAIADAKRAGCRRAGWTAHATAGVRTASRNIAGGGNTLTRPHTPALWSKLNQYHPP